MSPLRVLQQQIPLARSILWAPTGSTRPADANFPVFLGQSALQAIYEHLATVPPPGQGIVGFMLGDRFECPVTGVSYSVIDAALRLNQTIYGDHTRDVVTRLWKRLDAQLEAQRAHLIGWYHTHAPLPLEMSVHDVETHQQYFSEPWQVAVVVGTDATTPAGAFFRAGSDDKWVRTPQPFYELLNEDSVRPDGKKRSFMTWKTYRAYNPPALQPRASTSAPPPPPAKRAPPPPRPEPAPPPPPPRVEERDESPQSEEMENMPQAEFEEPARTELEEPPRASPPAPPRTSPAEEEEWEDPGELRFLSAAEDIAAAPSSAPPPRPVPSAPAPVAPAPSDWDEQPPADLPYLEEPAPEELEPTPTPPPKPRAARRRISFGSGRMWRRIIKVGLLGVVVAAGWVGYQRFGPALLQRVKSFIPSRRAPVTVKPRAAAPRPPAPRLPAAAPVAPAQPAPTPPAPRPVRRALPANPAFALLDQTGDSLERALQAYDGRMRLFETRRLDCSSLGRGLVRVERAVARYSGQRGVTRATLDPEREARDRDLRSGIESAGRKFQRSQCERQ